MVGVSLPGAWLRDKNFDIKKNMYLCTQGRVPVSRNSSVFYLKNDTI